MRRAMEICDGSTLSIDPRPASFRLKSPFAKSKRADVRRRKPLTPIGFRATLAAHSMLLVITFGIMGGCSSLLYRFSTPVPSTFVANPISLPPAEDNFVWLQVVDVVDDFFHVRTEQPVQNRGDIILDGRLETSYRVGASLAEPWRKDSTAGFERLQSTLQSIRRRAIVTVRPDGAGYELEVIVQKELEDTDRSQYATEAAAAPKRDVTIVRTDDSVNDTPRTLGWIPLGRDESLEQVILQDILGRITKADGKRLLHHK